MTGPLVKVTLFFGQLWLQSDQITLFMKTAQRPVQTSLDQSLECLCILRYSHMLGKDPHAWEGHIHMPGNGPHAWYGCRTIRWGMMHHLPWCNAQAVQSGHFSTLPHTPPHGMAPLPPHMCPPPPPPPPPACRLCPLRP